MMTPEEIEQAELRDKMRGKFFAGMNVTRGHSSWISANVGCSLAELKRHLEAQFKPGMHWLNNTTEGWHIDHIRPLVAFDLTDPVQQRQAWHYTNLQPLWATENLSKGSRCANIAPVNL